MGQPVEKRNFRYDDIIFPAGQGRQWGPNASVPDVSRPETKLWFYFLARSYIDLGFEAIHWGQMELMNKNDRSNASWEQVLTLTRAYAAEHARRHMVVCDAHVPSGGLVRDGKLLLDFHAFPLRIMEVPDKPEEAILKVGFSDGLYGRSKGGLHFQRLVLRPSPYLVELDNYGVSKHPSKPNETGSFNWVWGYDEISSVRASEFHVSQQLAELRLGVGAAKPTPTAGSKCPAAAPSDPRSTTAPGTLRERMRQHDLVPDGLADEDAIRAIWSADSRLHLLHGRATTSSVHLRHPSPSSGERAVWPRLHPNRGAPTL